MKKLSLILTLAGLVALSQAGIAQSIVGSAHDFSTAAWNSSSPKEICIVCHTPHNANTSVSNAPLWNHALSAVASYTPYQSGTMQSTAGQPDGASKLCLSCHDGTVALENFGGTTSGTNKVLTKNLVGNGGTLADDHPISIAYDGTLAGLDHGLKNPSESSGIAGGSTINADLLIDGKMQCSSCHDVHNSVSGTTHLLRVSNAGSALCLTCHKK
jgi:predicted CXXCH cytochrome family protein